MNDEQYEHAMDMQFAQAAVEHRTDLYDSAQDARSESRYEPNDFDALALGAWEDTGAVLAPLEDTWIL